MGFAVWGLGFRLFMLGFVILRCPLAARRTFRNPPLKVYKEIPVSETPTVEVRAFAGLEQGSKEAEVPRQHDHVQVPPTRTQCGVY